MRIHDAPHARLAGRRLTPASLTTHVIRFCGDVGCRGHRTERPPAPPASLPATPRPPRLPARPMKENRRLDAYNAQNPWRTGRLTPRQQRQVDRAAAARQREWDADTTPLFRTEAP